MLRRSGAAGVKLRPSLQSICLITRLSKQILIGITAILTILFDIDGTMIRVAKSISRDVFLGAIRDVVGEPSIGIPADYHFHGRTDRSIYHDICAHADIAEPHAESVCQLFEAELE